jgi:flagellar biosynthesis/type III secretory pathway protein FliH
LILPAVLRVRYTAEVDRIHEEKRMPYVTSVEREHIAAAERVALQQGRQEGRQEGQAAVLLRLLERRWGGVDDDVRAAVGALSPERLEALADGLLDFGSVDEVKRWLSRG